MFRNGQQVRDYHLLFVAMTSGFSVALFWVVITKSISTLVLSATELCL